MMTHLERLALVRGVIADIVDNADDIRRAKFDPDIFVQELIQKWESELTFAKTMYQVIQQDDEILKRLENHDSE
jgi:hypothetical protein